SSWLCHPRSPRRLPTRPSSDLPNVGKSTLFNRLVGQKLALVDDMPGVTRDRREGEAKLGDLQFTIIDTAGLDEGPKGSLTARMRSEEHTSELQSHLNLVCRLLL